jgi:hypothetical protein
MPLHKTADIKRVIRATTVTTVVAILAIIGWTGFFMAQALDFIPTLSEELVTTESDVPVEKVNAALLEKDLLRLREKQASPEPLVDEISNPFGAIPSQALPGEATGPGIAP